MSKDLFRSSGLEQQGLAANIDYVFIIMSADEDFSIRRAERYLSCVKNSDSKPVILLNKIEKHANSSNLLDELREIDEEIPVFGISVHENIGIEQLNPYIKNTIAIVGSSGVGKSSLINKLAGKEIQTHSYIRESDSKGRHTTTRRSLILLYGGGVLIDNPGIREIQVWATSEMLGIFLAIWKNYLQSASIKIAVIPKKKAVPYKNQYEPAN